MRTKLKLLLIVLFFGLVVSAALASEARVLLNAVTGTGAGTSVAFDDVYTEHTWYTIINGSPTSVSVLLEGSLDGDNWFTLDTSTSTVNEMRHVVNKPVTFIRGRVTTLSGGSTPTITVKSVHTK